MENVFLQILNNAIYKNLDLMYVDTLDAEVVVAGILQPGFYPGS